MYRESFLRDSELTYIEATRSTLLQPRTHIPTWLLVLLVVLGWNEFITILGSPIYFILALLLIGALFVGGYLPVFGSFIPTFTAFSNLLVTKILEYFQQFSNDQLRGESNDRNKLKSGFGPISSSHIRNLPESHFDTHRPVFNGNGYSRQSSPSSTEMESDDYPMSTIDERSSLLTSNSTGRS